MARAYRRGLVAVGDQFVSRLAAVADIVELIKVDERDGWLRPFKMHGLSARRT